jgi:hypothetical protein
MSNGLHEGEMALELAEYDMAHMTIPELLEIAGDALKSSWLQRAVDYPERVRDQYNNLIGEK